MIIKQISLTRGFTANIGDDNNVRFELGLTAELGEGETVDEVIALLDQQIGGVINDRRKQIKEWVKARYGSPAKDEGGEG